MTVSYYEKLLSAASTHGLPLRDCNGTSSAVESIAETVAAKEIDAFCGKQQVSPSAFFSSALGILLASFSGSESAFFTRADGAGLYPAVLQQ